MAGAAEIFPESTQLAPEEGPPSFEAAPRNFSFPTTDGKNFNAAFPPTLLVDPLGHKESGDVAPIIDSPTADASIVDNNKVNASAGIPERFGLAVLVSTVLGILYGNTFGANAIFIYFNGLNSNCPLYASERSCGELQHTDCVWNATLSECVFSDFAAAGVNCTAFGGDSAACGTVDVCAFDYVENACYHQFGFTPIQAGLIAGSTVFGGIILPPAGSAMLRRCGFRPTLFALGLLVLLASAVTTLSRCLGQRVWFPLQVAARVLLGGAITVGCSLGSLYAMRVAPTRSSAVSGIFQTMCSTGIVLAAIYALVTEPTDYARPGLKMELRIHFIFAVGYLGGAAAIFAAAVATEEKASLPPPLALPLPATVDSHPEDSAIALAAPETHGDSKEESADFIDAMLMSDSPTMAAADDFEEPSSPSANTLKCSVQTQKGQQGAAEDVSSPIHQGSGPSLLARAGSMQTLIVADVSDDEEGIQARTSPSDPQMYEYNPLSPEAALSASDLCLLPLEEGEHEQLNGEEGETDASAPHAAPTTHNESDDDEEDASSHLSPCAFALCLIVCLAAASAGCLSAISAVVSFGPQITAAAGFPPIMGYLVIQVSRYFGSLLSQCLPRYFHMRSIYTVGNFVLMIATAVVGFGLYPFGGSDSGSGWSVVQTVCSGAGLLTIGLTYNAAVGPGFWIWMSRVFPKAWHRFGASFGNIAGSVMQLAMYLLYPTAVVSFSGGPAGNQNVGQAIMFWIMAGNTILNLAVMIPLLHDYDEHNSQSNGSALLDAPTSPEEAA